MAYKKNNKDLFVTYKNTGKYVYKDVPLGTYLALRKAPSLGKYIHMNIKGKYDYEKLLSSVPEATKQEAAQKVAYLMQKIALMQGLGELVGGGAVGGVLGGALAPKGNRMLGAAIGSAIGATVAKGGTKLAPTYKPAEAPKMPQQYKMAYYYPMLRLI